MSGLPTESLYFCGFIPRSGAERSEAVERIKNSEATVVLYESPHRVAATFADFSELFPNRECALVREITKTFEQVIRGTAAELAARFAENEPKGECVIVISPCDNNIAADNTKLRETVGILLNAGIGAKNTAKIASSILNVPKNEAYRLALEYRMNKCSRMRH